MFVPSYVDNVNSFFRIVEIVEADGTVALIEIVGEIQTVHEYLAYALVDAPVYLVVAVHA